MAKKKNPKSSATPKKAKQSKVADLIISKNFWQKNRLPAILLFAISILLYIQTVSYTYVLDDKIVYHENNFVKNGLSGIPDLLGTESMVGYFGEQKNLVQGGRYRPLSLVTFAIEHQFFGNDNYKVEEYWTNKMQAIPDLTRYMDAVKKNGNIFEAIYPDEESFLNALSGAIPRNEIDKHKKDILFYAAFSNPGISHFVNVLFFGLLVLLLFRILHILFPAVSSEWYLSLAFIGTLLFALHPIHVEAVANVKGRDEIMALIGALGAMYFTLKYIAEEKTIHLILSGFVFLLGLLAKENVMTFFALIPLTTYFFTKSSFKKNAISLIPLAIAFFIFLFMRMKALDLGHLFDFGVGKPSTDLMNNPFVEMSGSERLATVFYTLGLYVKLLFFPHPLTHDYYPYQIPIMNWGNMGSILSLLLYLAMGAYAVWGMMKKNVVAYGILFFLIPLSIVSNLAVSVGTFMNERFLFFSSIGFCIVMAYWISRKLPGPVLNLGLLAILVLGYSAKTFTRTPAWKDAYALNSSGVKNSPNSARANLYMGTATFKNFYKKETDRNLKKEYLDEVNGYVTKALDIYPRYGSALKMKVIVATEYFNSDNDIDRLLKSFEEVVMLRRTDPSVDIYLDYFKRQGSWTNQLLDFSHRVGYDYFVQRVGDYQTGMKYINYGLSLSPGNALLQQDALEVRQLLGQ